MRHGGPPTVLLLLSGAALALPDNCSVIRWDALSGLMQDSPVPDPLGNVPRKLVCGVGWQRRRSAAFAIAALMAAAMFSKFFEPRPGGGTGVDETPFLGAATGLHRVLLVGEIVLCDFAGRPRGVKEPERSSKTTKGVLGAGPRGVQAPERSSIDPWCAFGARPRGVQAPERSSSSPCRSLGAGPRGVLEPEAKPDRSSNDTWYVFGAEPRGVPAPDRSSNAD